MPDVNLFDKFIEVYVTFDIQTEDGCFITDSCWCWGTVIEILSAT